MRKSVKKTTNLVNDLLGMLRWLVPGLGVKRWIGIMLIGVTFLGVGFAYFLLDIYRTSAADDVLSVLDVATLRFIPRPARVVVFVIAGLGFLL